MVVRRLSLAASPVSSGTIYRVEANGAVRRGGSRAVAFGNGARGSSSTNERRGWSRANRHDLCVGAIWWRSRHDKPRGDAGSARERRPRKKPYAQKDAGKPRRRAEGRKDAAVPASSRSELVRYRSLGPPPPRQQARKA